jgi:hypothetical protein
MDMSIFRECKWKAFCGKEAIPPNAPLPTGKYVDRRMFIDSDHAGDKRIWPFRTGFIIYLYMSPVNWFSKKQQSTIKTSV